MSTAKKKPTSSPQRQHLRPTVVTEEHTDLSEAHFDPGLSGVDFEEKLGRFWATYDRVAFQSPARIARTLLKAHSFQDNLENVLATLDSLSLGYRVLLAPESLDAAQPSAQTFMPCVQAQLPDRKVRGPLLEAFYEEVAVFEEEILRLRQAEADALKRGEEQGQKGRGQALADARAEADALRHELARMSKKLKNLEVLSRESGPPQAQLPSDLHIARVQGIEAQRRVIHLKVGRKATLELSSQKLCFLPEIGEKGLVKVLDGEVEQVLFFDPSPRRPKVQQDLGVVTHSRQGRLLFRDGQRRQHSLKAESLEEHQLMAKVRRGDRLLVWSVAGEAVAFRPWVTPESKQWWMPVQEQVVLQQIQKAKD